MKKFFLALSIFTLALHSCSNDDNIDSQLPTDSGSLLKKITYGDGSYDTYNYNGNALVSIITNDHSEDIFYTYSGDNITKIETKDEVGDIINSVSYFYDSNGKITHIVEYDNSVGMESYYKSVYTYNANGTIKGANYSGDISGQNTYEGYDIYYYDSNKNQTKAESYDVNGDLEFIDSAEFDNKNCPIKNIKGILKLIYIPHSELGMFNNFIKETTTEVGGSSITDTYTHTYNSNNYPITTVDSGETITYEYYN